MISSWASSCKLAVNSNYEWFMLFGTKMTCLYSCAMEVEGETHLMMLDACLICTLVPGIPHLQEAPHPVLQAVRIGHILLRRHTGTVFLSQIFIWHHRFCKHLLSGRWSCNLQFWSGSVLTRSQHWTLVTWWADGAGILYQGVEGYVKDALGSQGGGCP